MKLYFAPGACSMASHIALNEAGLKYSAEEVDLKKHVIKNNSSNYYEVNPEGVVPTLELDDGNILTENAVVLQYIADQNPKSGLLPETGKFERYRVKEWLNFVATELHKSFSTFFIPDSSDAEKQRATAKILKKFELVESNLKGQKYLMGEQVTVADFYMFVMLRWAKSMGFEMDRFTALNVYYDELLKRPSVIQTMKSEHLDIL